MRHFIKTYTNNRESFCTGRVTYLLVTFAVVLQWCISSTTLTAQSVFEKQGVSVIKTTQNSIVVRYQPILIGYDTVMLTNGAKSIRPLFSSATLLNEYQSGSPELYGQNLPLALPQENGFRISNISVKNVRTLYGFVPPVVTRFTKPISDDDHSQADESATEEKISIEPNTYFSKQQEWATIKYSGISATTYLGSLQIASARYNQELKAIEIPQTIEVTVVFDVPDYLLKTRSTIAQSNSIVSVLNEKQRIQWTISNTLNPRVSFKPTTEDYPLPTDIGNGTWVKIKVNQDGMYRIDATQLQQLGISIPKELVQTIKIFGNGGTELSEVVSDNARNQLKLQNIKTRTNSDGSFNSVIFYGAPASGFAYNSTTKRIGHYLNHYSNDNYYFMTFGGKQSVVSPDLPNPEGNVLHRPTRYIGRVFNEEELVCPYNTSGRRWLGRQVDEGNPRVYTTLLPNFVAEGNVNYRFVLAHKINNEVSFSIAESGRSISTIQLPAKDESTFSYVEYIGGVSNISTPSTAIQDSRSVLRFSFNNPKSNGVTNGFLDFFEIEYPAQFIANNNSLEFFSNSTIGLTEYSINGFSGEIFGADVTDRGNPKFLTNSASTGGMFIFRANEDSIPSRYYISSDLKIPSIEKTTWSNLRWMRTGADVVVITPSAFRNSADKFKKYRESQKELSVIVVTTEDINNEYGSGIADPTAIRDFLAQAMVNWSTKPRYVVLWGDGIFDYKQIVTNRVSPIVTYQTDDVIPESGTRAYDYTRNYTTEDYFVCVVGNDLIVDLATGRVPINSDAEGLEFVDKIEYYEHKSSNDAWRTYVTFVADDGPIGSSSEGSIHTNDSEAVATSLPNDIQQRKIYMAEYPTENIPRGRRKPRVTEDFLTTINNRGTLLLNWMGHGNPRVWAHENIYDRDVTTPLMVNKDKMFLLTAATCDFARFDLPDVQSGAEALMLSNRGAAIGIFSSSRVVFTSGNRAIAKEFYRQLFVRGTDGRYKTIGDVCASVKQTMYSENDQKYFILGDPTMRLLLPNKVVAFDSINGIAPDKDSLVVQIKALGEVTVKGRIVDATMNQISRDFNGTTTLALFDSDINFGIQDPSSIALFNDQAVHNFVTLGGALHRGTYKVDNGEFKATFVVPKDISFSDKSGRLFAYATSDKEVYAKGTTTDMTIGGIADNDLNDTQGPDISIFLDNRTFKPYDVVRSNPLLIADLRDNTGINMTGVGVGHKIEAWLDDNTEAIDLTNDFTTSLTDSRSGSTNRQLSRLTPGTHSVKVRGWDVVNNFSESTTYFVVGQDDRRVISGRSEVYPNPFSTKTTIFFTHNQGFTFDVELRIFNVQGKQVFISRQSNPNLQSGFFEWNAKDEEGQTLPQGVYPYSLWMYSPDGSIEVVHGQVVHLD
jgi:hypothetical protein